MIIKQKPLNNLAQECADALTSRGLTTPLSTLFNFGGTIIDASATTPIKESLNDIINYTDENLESNLATTPGEIITKDWYILFSTICNDIIGGMRCSANCVGVCVGCTGYCTGSCSGGCTGGCGGGCRGGWWASCGCVGSNSGCSGTCRLNCSSNCSKTCNTLCETTCTNTTYSAADSSRYPGSEIKLS